jgi:hypothetical protein
MRRLLVIPAFLFVAASCVAPNSPSNQGDTNGSAVESPSVAEQEAKTGGQGRADSLGGSGCTSRLCTEIKREYGVRPRIYNAFFDESCHSETLFLAALDKVKYFLNDRAEKRGLSFDFHRAELATNFITEGGYFVLEECRTAGISGFDKGGIDAFVTEYARFKEWVHPELKQLIPENPSQVEPESHRMIIERTNEVGDTFKTLDNIDTTSAVLANAAMYAWKKQQVFEDIKASMPGQNLDDLSKSEEYFWTTVYFNGGEGAGRQSLQNEGISWVNETWRLDDDPKKFGGRIRYNALWRTATFEYMLESVCKEPQSEARRSFCRGW